MLWDKGGGGLWGGENNGDFLRGLAMGRATAEPIPVPVQVADVETTAQLAVIIKRLQDELYETQQGYARARSQAAGLRAALVALTPICGRNTILSVLQHVYPGAYIKRAKEVGRNVNDLRAEADLVLESEISTVPH